MSTGRVKVLDVSPEEAKKVADITALCAGERLRSIRNPTLLIADADDLLVPWQLSELIAEEIAHARLVKLDHGGHHFPRQGGRRREFLDLAVELHELLDRRPWEVDVFYVDAIKPVDDQEQGDWAGAAAARCALLAALQQQNG